MRASERKRVQDAIIKSLSDGASVVVACEAAGISRQTFYDWMERDVFRERVEKTRLELVKTVQSVALACALKAENDPRYQASLRTWLQVNDGWSGRVAEEIGDLHGERDEIMRRIGSLVERIGTGDGSS